MGSTLRRISRLCALAVSAAAVAACGSGGGGGGSGRADPSHDSNLAALGLSAGTLTPAFASLTTDYAAKVAFEDATILVTPIASGSGATITVNGAAVQTGHASDPVSLVVLPGVNPVSVVVTAADGTTTSTYTVNVSRPPPNGTLEALTILETGLSPQFHYATTAYSAEVEYPVTSIRVTATLANPSDVLWIQGVATVSNVASPPIPLNVSPALNPITVEVKSPDGTPLTQYVVGVLRHADTRLSAVATSAGLLSPVFDPTKKSYTLTVGLALPAVSISATTQDPAASLTWNGVAGASGVPTAPIAITAFAAPTLVDCTVTGADGTSKATYKFAFSRSTTVAQEAYVKAAIPHAGDVFGGGSPSVGILASGSGISISGNTMVVGAPLESSKATGIDGDETDTSAFAAGAAYVFVREGSSWTQQAYLKASNTGAADEFGYSVAISGDTIVVGAPNEASATTGVNGSGSDNSASARGAVYVFVRSGTTWSQQAYLKAANASDDHAFGAPVAISGDTIVVGCRNIGYGATESGSAWVFVRSGTTWSQQAQLKASNADLGDVFGWHVAVEGDRVVVTAPGEASNATGVGGNASNNSMPYAGAAYVFARSGTTWSQEAYLKPSNPDANDWFGAGGLGLSGNTIVVGATGEASTATGVNGNQSDNSCKGVGAAYVFVKSGGSWSQQAYLKASYNANHGVAALFGGDAAIQGDTILIGAAGEKSAATGIGGEQGDETRDQSGAAYLFTRSAGVWTQASYMKASNTDAGDAFGLHVAISGETIVISAAGEASAAGGTDIDPSDNSAPDAGAVYVIR